MRKYISILLLISVCLSANAQFTDSTTGLLSSPSAEMNAAGVFAITNNFLNQNQLSPNGWDYNTFGYGFNITFWSRLELGYVCTIFNGDWSPKAQGPTGTEREKIMKNQDRHFVAKVLALREGEIWQWTPSIAIGISDPATGGGTGEYIGSDPSRASNAYFNRMYIVATKHFSTGWGEMGATVGYQYSFRKERVINFPCAAVTWKPIWLQNRWFDPKFILEYDSRTPNIGFIADIWDSRFQAMFELQNFRWISFGLRFKVRLKGSE